MLNTFKERYSSLSPIFEDKVYGLGSLLGLGVSRCPICVVSDTDTTPTLVITLNFVIFLNY